MTNFHDGYLQQGAPVGALTTQLALTTNNVIIDISSTSWLILTSDNATASNRVFTLTGGSVQGHKLTIIMITGSSKTCKLANSGNCQLNNADWTPLQYDQIELMWDAGTSFWHEVARKPVTTSQLHDFKITSAADNNILYYKAADSAWENVATSGDVTNSAGALTIAAGAVTLAKMANLAAKNVLVGPASTGAPAAINTTTGTSASRILARQLTGTFTVTIAAPGVFTATGHGMLVNDAVFLTTTGALPTGLAANTTYYVQNVADANTFQLAATQGGAAITTTGTQSGVHTFNSSGLSPQPLSICNADIAVAAAVSYAKMANDSAGDVTNSGATITIAAGAVTLSKLDPQVVVQTAAVSLTQAQIQGLSVTPVQIIAQPGSGKVIVVQDVEILHTYSTTQYANGGKLQVQYHGTSDIVDVAATVVTAASSDNFYVRPNVFDVDNSTGSTPVSITSFANLAVDLTNATAPFITGNAANIIKVVIRYYVKTLAT